jgi:hypothetical protein
MCDKIKTKQKLANKTLKISLSKMNINDTCITGLGITEVKQRWTRLVSGGGDHQDNRVLLAFPTQGEVKVRRRVVAEWPPSLKILEGIQ